MASDAGKMFIFCFSTKVDERRRLLGHCSLPGNDVTAEIKTGISSSKISLMQAHQRLAEWGDKLSDLGLKMELMKKNSEEFYQTMKVFNNKIADKNWYEF
ncbi:hypothetical protein CCR75_003013 [Bremia lactucae]|uniref:V-SNARE coiled-coil homology domain-containing protein n=1 Tax=Bremia lactucae TaxID=4779 RepID=A0A976IBJ5_BRELC|nr:hypothetical protein CCR75_003013 [Bremia lactucae]